MIPIKPPPFADPWERHLRIAMEAERARVRAWLERERDRVARRKPYPPTQDTKA